MRAFFREGHPAINTILGDGQSDYLNRRDVREALNIPSYLPPYEQCSDPIYNTYKSYREGSLWIYPTLKKYGYRLMHYSGDTDGAVPTLGTRKWIDQQEWSVSRAWRAWTTDD
jgi:serine carboxypeptidase-like clade 2